MLDVVHRENVSVESFIAHLRSHFVTFCVFVQAANSFVNDSLLTTVCIQYRPNQVAAAVVYLSYLYMGLPRVDTTLLEVDSTVVAGENSGACSVWMFRIIFCRGMRSRDVSSTTCRQRRCRSAERAVGQEGAHGAHPRQQGVWRLTEGFGSGIYTAPGRSPQRGDCRLHGAFMLVTRRRPKKG